MTTTTSSYTYLLVLNTYEKKKYVLSPETLKKETKILWKLVPEDWSFPIMVNQPTITCLAECSSDQSKISQCPEKSPVLTESDDMKSHYILT